MEDLAAGLAKEFAAWAPLGPCEVYSLFAPVGRWLGRPWPPAPPPKCVGRAPPEAPPAVIIPLGGA
jgi:hypothetical protein